MFDSCLIFSLAQFFSRLERTSRSWWLARRRSEPSTYAMRHRTSSIVLQSKYFWDYFHVLRFKKVIIIMKYRSVKSQDAFSITCNDGSTLRGAKCSSSIFGRGSMSAHACLNVGTLGAKALKFVKREYRLIFFACCCIVFLLVHYFFPIVA